MKDAAQLNELLGRFVGKNDPRAYLNDPIIRDGFVYATNGHIVVRVPEFEHADASHSKDPKKLTEFFDDNIATEFVPIPLYDAPGPCLVCHGTGLGYKCDVCDGVGEFDKGTNTYECQECDGTGQVDDGTEHNQSVCNVCDGVKTDQTLFLVKVGNNYFDRKYLIRIADLPDLDFGNAEPMAPTYFTFEGGEGLIMPCRK